MITIEKKKVQIKIGEDIHDIPIKNMTTSLAFKLSDLQKKRELLMSKESSEREAFELVNEMFAVLIDNYEDNKKIVDEIPIDLIEEFMNECLEIIQGKKKSMTNTKRKLTE